MLLGDQHPEPGPAVVTSLQVEGKAIEAAALAFAQQALEVSFPRQAAGSAKPEALIARGYSPRRRLPLARRLRMTFRPPGVRPRTRNP
jgi:hypothetical protein